MYIHIYIHIYTYTTAFQGNWEASEIKLNVVQPSIIAKRIRIILDCLTYSKLYIMYCILYVIYHIILYIMLCYIISYDILSYIIQDPPGEVGGSHRHARGDAGPHPDPAQGSVEPKSGLENVQFRCSILLHQFS